MNSAQCYVKMYISVNNTFGIVCTQLEERDWSIVIAMSRRVRMQCSIVPVVCVHSMFYLLFWLQILATLSLQLFV